MKKVNKLKVKKNKTKKTKQTPKKNSKKIIAEKKIRIPHCPECNFKIGVSKIYKKGRYSHDLLFCRRCDWTKEVIFYDKNGQRKI